MRFLFLSWAYNNWHPRTLHHFIVADRRYPGRRRRSIFWEFPAPRGPDLVGFGLSTTPFAEAGTISIEFTSSSPCLDFNTSYELITAITSCVRPLHGVVCWSQEMHFVYQFPSFPKVLSLDHEGYTERSMASFVQTPGQICDTEGSS